MRYRRAFARFSEGEAEWEARELEGEAREVEAEVEAGAVWRAYQLPRVRRAW